MTWVSFDAEAERSLLSNWIYNERFRAAFPFELGLIRSGPHLEIARAALEIHAAGLPLDDSAVIVELQKRDRLGNAGGFEKVNDVINNTATVGDPWKIVERLREYNGLAALRKGLLEAVSGIETGGSDLAGSKEALSAILREAVSGVGSRVTTVQQALAAAMNTALTKLSDDSTVICPTNFYEIDNVCGWLRRGHVWVFGGVTNWGKSSFTVALLDEVMLQAKKALVVSNEDSEELYGRRLLARRSGVNATRLRDRKLDHEEMAMVTQTVAEAPADPFFLNAIGRAAEDVASDVRSICASDGIDFVVFDYMQKFRAKARTHSRHEELEYIRNILSDTVKMSNACGFELSQLTDVKPGERPTRDNLRDCKSLGHGAEFILLGYTDGGQRRIYIDKVKDGPADVEISMDWDNKTASFRSDRQRQDEQVPVGFYDQM